MHRQTSKTPNHRTGTLTQQLTRHAVKEELFSWLDTRFRCCLTVSIELYFGSNSML